MAPANVVVPALAIEITDDPPLLNIRLPDDEFLIVKSPLASRCPIEPLDPLLSPHCQSIYA